MRELITIQVGQCGNQIGAKFWELAIKEHSKYNKSSVYDDALSSFFRNIDKSSKGHQLKVGSEIINLKARSIIVDMEEGVTNQLLKSDIGDLFDQRQFINDVSGAGNNWAHGHFFYGNKYRDNMSERIRKAVEQCDSLQCFFLMHSLGGGTGSGLGTYLLSLIEDEYPDVYRFTASVFPQKDDDVITSPYNSFFSLYELAKHADCVFPIDNQALMNICYQIDNPSKAKLSKDNISVSKEEEIKIMMNKGSKITQSGTEEKKEKPFDKMNNIIAHLLSNITCSMRFEGVLNVDLNEITMNLVPYPDLHFLISSIAPLYSLSDSNLQPRRLDQMFKDCYHPDYQLVTVNPFQNKYLAVGLMVRGSVPFSDVNRNIKKLRSELNMIYWNQEGFKYGICNTPPIGQPYSLLCLANNTAIRDQFQTMVERFNKLYKRRVFVHHYTEYMDAKHFDEALNSITSLISKYEELHKVEEPSSQPRLKPLI
ncbi:hypothetical protein ABPG72_015433 [Tetrahymena utriculariae]